MKMENDIAPVRQRGFRSSDILGAERAKTMAPKMITPKNDDAQAIFTSGARSSERKVARARAAAGSGTPGRRRSRNCARLTAGATVAAGAAAGCTRAVVLTLASPR